MWERSGTNIITGLRDEMLWLEIAISKLRENRKITNQFNFPNDSWKNGVFSNKQHPKNVTYRIRLAGDPHAFEEEHSTLHWSKINVCRELLKYS
jgi:hypothetical protein